MLKKQILVILLLSFSALSWGQVAPASGCNFQYSENAKKCPTSGSTLLDDTYPVASYVISVMPFRESAASAKVPGKFILEMLKGNNFAENGPNVIVPASETEFAALKVELEKMVAESKGKIPASILNKVISAPAPEVSFTWQQDYFESFVNPESGRPVLRRLGAYNNGGFTSLEATETLASAAGSCGITQGPKLASDNEASVAGGKSFGNGEMGGNIEGLPGGLCLVGDNLSSKVSSQFCGDAANVVQTDVSWLTVGHVDELMKVIPTNIPGVPAECNFSLAFASPKKALELLAEPRAANHTFFSGDFLSEGATAAQIAEFRTSRGSRAVGGKFCKIWKNFGPQPATAPNSNPAGQKKAFYFFQKLLISNAYAGVEVIGGRACELEKLTNAQFLKAMQEDPEFKEYNELVQKTMDDNKKKVTDQVLARLPQCRAHLNIMDVPDLFYGTLGTDAAGNKILPKPGNGGSFFPNPTNSVIANNTVVFPDPQNPLFRDYLSKDLKGKGIKSSFIDTWDYAHLGDGNLHCSSHSIPYCSPAAQGNAR